MAKIAILGFGTVGSGVPEILETAALKIENILKEPLEVKYILDVRDFSGHKDQHLFVKDIDQIMQDDEVSIVVEAIGGVRPAADFVRRFLESGRSVVTSNKELVASFGAEFLAIAKRKGVCFMFEAVLAAECRCSHQFISALVQTKVQKIAGIVNGTTNFMLTMMQKDGADFDSALKMAQQLGYAETIDPSSDVDGEDAARKIAILSSLCFGKHIYVDNIPAKGIRSIGKMDMQNALKNNATIKLIAWARNENEKFTCGVEPMFVSKQNPLASVNGVYNAVLLNCDFLGDVQFYGEGAGRLPTASAIVTDMMDIVRNGKNIHNSLFWSQSEKVSSTFKDTGVYSYYIRFEELDKQIIEKISISFAEAGDNAILVEKIKAENFLELLEKLESIDLKPKAFFKYLDLKFDFVKFETIKC